jgi:Rrf2 family transcriptional regulator, nitric oxide-sensitive transcriptional repressor
MRRSKTVAGAFKILLYCGAAGDRFVKMADLSEALRITPSNVAKIVYLLSHGGFLTGTPGRNGGVRLARHSRQISVGGVVRVIEQSFARKADIARGAHRAELKYVVDVATAAFFAVLDQHSLYELLHNQRNGSVPERPKSKITASGRALLGMKIEPTKRH